MTNIHLIKTKNSVTKAAAQNKHHPTNYTTINIKQANFANPSSKIHGRSTNRKHLRFPQKVAHVNGNLLGYPFRPTATS